MLLMSSRELDFHYPVRFQSSLLSLSLACYEQSTAPTSDAVAIEELRQHVAALRGE